MPRLYLPFENPNRGYVPTLGGILPGTPPPTIVGNPHLRGGPFVGLPGYGMEAAEAVVNMLVDPHFPSLTNWPAYNTPTTREVGPQFAMDQGAFFQGLHIVSDEQNEGAYQTVTLADATAYVASVWAYVVAGTIQLYIDKGAGAESVSNGGVVKRWIRLVKAFTSDGTAGGIYLRTDTVGTEGYFWMPQLALGTYAKPARVGTQLLSYLTLPSPISETQTPWSVLCAVTPDWAYDTAISYPGVWSLYEGASDSVDLYFDQVVDKWAVWSRAGGSGPSMTSTASTHARGDKAHLAVTCDGYNAYLYVNGVKSGPIAIASVQPTSLIVGAKTTAGTNPFNGVVDDFAFLEGCALPDFRVQELYRAFLRGVPLHGLVEVLV